MISEFKVNIDKQKVFDTVQSYYQMPSNDIFESKFHNLSNILYRLSKPKGIFLNEKKNNFYDFESLSDCSNIIYCIVTIGENVTKHADYLFNNGEFFDGILFDAMSSEMLFEISNQFYSYIKKEAEKMGFGLTCKLSPGDGEIPLTYQQDIFERFDRKVIPEMYIFQGCMLYPTKSMSYIYGAGEKIPVREKDHCCSECSNNFCMMRRNVEHM